MSTQQSPSLIALAGALCVGLGGYMLLIPKDTASTLTFTTSIPFTETQPTHDTLDLSEDYGIVKATVFHKKNLIAFSSPAEFFNYSGKTSFEGLVFDRINKLPSGLRFVDGRPLTAADYRRAMGGK